MTEFSPQTGHLSILNNPGRLRGESENDPGRSRPFGLGVAFGAKPKLSKNENQELIRDFEAPGCSKTEIAEHYGIARTSVYRLYAENRQDVPAMH